MTTNWPEVALGDLVEIRHGFAFKGEYFRDEAPGDILLTPGNFAIGGGFKRDQRKFYRGPVPEEFVLQPGELLVSMTDLSKHSDTLGYAAVVPQPPPETRYLHNQRLGKVTVKGDAAIELRFLHYLLRSNDYREEVLASATGTTVKHTSPDRLRRFRFNCPPLAEQGRIARILSSLDEKIELNRRQNDSLEAIARAMFRSWFIDFDPVRAKADEQSTGLSSQIANLFPDHFEDSEFGLIPNGWHVAPLGQVVTINPLRSLRKGTVAPYLEMNSMPNDSARATNVVNREFGSGMRFMNGDTLVARITPCLENGKTCFVDFLEDEQVGWGSTEYVVLSPSGIVPPLFAYFLARTEVFRSHAISSMSGSSGRQRVSLGALERFLVVVPPSEISQQFDRHAIAILSRMRTNDEQRITLTELRDGLLPRLISGELRGQTIPFEV